jgi:hypothetical protein
MLWFDKSEERDLEDKLHRAADYYEAKYGERPTACYLHPSMIFGSPSHLAGLDLVGTNTVLPHHFWLGKADEVVQQRSAA